ncbi:MAG: LytR/AlgR family response regulator transcription factor [Omnitrophica WOR_2 bacterium]|jgi:two-component system LytT family response regulator
MTRAVIVDDEYNSRDNVKQLLRLCCSDVEVVGEADGVKAGIECIKSTKPDLVFLDIKMADGSGFDLLLKLGKFDFRLIFVTAFDDYALKAFRFNAIDYLTKPINPEELRQAVQKVTSSANVDPSGEAIKSLLESFGVPTAPKKIILKTLNTIHVIEVDDIIRCESDRNYTIFHMKDGDDVLISRSMKEYNEMLAEYGFIRIHNSHLINLKYVKRFLRDELICVLKDNSNIPVSYRKRDELFARINNL